MGQVEDREQLSLFDLGVDVARLRAEVHALVAAGVNSDNTQKAYGSDWKLFAAWCSKAGRVSLPASEETVCLYLADLARRRRVGTVSHHVFAIRSYHLAAGHASPIGASVKQMMAGLRRSRGCETQPKAVLMPELLRAISRRLDRRRAKPARDAAILLLGFVTGLRRSDLVALNLEDVKFLRQGLVVHVGRRKREKNDQPGNGRDIAVFPGSRRETCPIRALDSWLRHRGKQPGPLFTRLDVRAAGAMRLSAPSVNDIVQESVAVVGEDPAGYGAHSLRAGMVTACAAAGASDSTIMLRSGHGSAEMVKRYRRHADLFYSNPLAKAL